MNVVYGCCVGSWDRFTRYVVPRIGNRRVVTVYNSLSIAVAYNAIFDACERWAADMVVLLHDDLELIDPDGERKLLNALWQDDVVVAGVAGARSITSLAWWEADTVGHQQIDSMLIDFGERSGDVDVLEGSLLAFSPLAVRNIRFDTGYPGFHGYDCDITLTAHSLGRVVVADVDTFHHTHLGFKSPESGHAWHKSDQRLRAKWSL